MTAVHGGQHTRGFTLIELMVASLISAVVVVGAASYLGNIGTRSARAYTEAIVKDDVLATLNALKRDILLAGTGIPEDLMALDPIALATSGGEATAAFIADAVIRDQDAVGPTGADSLTVGGVALDSGGPRTGVVIAESVLANQVAVSRQDSIAIAELYDPAKPSYLDPVEGDYISVLDPADGWRSASPLLIRNVGWNSLNIGRFDITVAGNFAPLPFYDEVAIYQRAVNGIAPGHLQQARWALAITAGDQTGNLERTHIQDAANASVSALAPVVMLDNVVDFQVSFLVWSCGDAEPTWTDHLWDAVADTGEFSTASCYNPNPGGIGDADRFMAMRARLSGVRVTIVLREREPRADGRAADNPQFDPGLPGQITVDNNTRTGLDTRYRYYVVEQVFDPYNLRLKTATSGTELYPPVRDLSMAQATLFQGAYYAGRNAAAGN